MNKKRYLLFITSCLLITACGQKHNTETPAETTSGIQNHYYSGDLRKALSDMKSTKSFSDSCDLNDDIIIEKIITKIEEHHGEIEAYNKQASAEPTSEEESGDDEESSFNEGEELVQKFVIPTNFKIFETQMNRPLNDKVSYQISDSWTKRFENITAHTLSPQEWAELEESVRADFVTDFNRRTEFINYYTPTMKWPILVDLHRSLLKCQKLKNCDFAKWKTLLNQKQSEHLNENPLLQHFVKQIDMTSIETQKTGLSALEEHLKTNISFRKFQKSENVSLIKANNQNVYRVLLSSSTLDDTGKAFFKTKIENFWSNEKNKVEIVWVDKNTSLQPFEIVLNDASGRAYVDTDEKSLHLFQGQTLSIILHEFGHVLGIPDRYYELRDLSTCQYTTEYIETDMMSSNLPGSNWLATDWLELQKIY